MERSLELTTPGGVRFRFETETPYSDAVRLLGRGAVRAFMNPKRPRRPAPPKKRGMRDFLTPEEQERFKRQVEILTARQDPNRKRPVEVVEY